MVVSPNSTSTVQGRHEGTHEPAVCSDGALLAVEPRVVGAHLLNRAEETCSIAEGTARKKAAQNQRIQHALGRLTTCKTVE